MEVSKLVREVLENPNNKKIMGIIFFHVCVNKNERVPFIIFIFGDN